MVVLEKQSCYAQAVLGMEDPRRLWQGPLLTLQMWHSLTTAADSKRNVGRSLGCAL